MATELTTAHIYPLFLMTKGWRIIKPADGDPFNGLYLSHRSGQRMIEKGVVTGLIEMKLVEEVVDRAVIATKGNYILTRKARNIVHVRC